MSGPLGSSQWMYSSGFYPYQIDQSLRFNDDDSAYLSRTPASAGNRKTWTWSGWVKRGNLGGNVFFGVSNGSTTQFYIQFSGGDALGVDDWNGSIQLRRVTNAVFRDPSAWYHVVVALDTTQATASDRVKIYVNGEQITSFSLSTDPGLNYDGAVNTAAPHALGREEFADTAYFDGYMAEVNFIDGTALDPTSFGEFKSGVWIPKKYTGSYGTNGFYLSFADSAAIGDDLSGNGNDWTPSGLASTDVMLDSPTNNYAVWNPLSSVATLADGNLLATNVFALFYATMHLPKSGKWYWEITNVAMGSQGYEMGIASGAQISIAGGYGWDAKLGRKWENAVVTTGQPTAAAGSIIGFAYDADAGTLAITDDGAAVFTISSIPLGDYRATVTGAGTGGTDIARANFGQSPFAYTPPAGFLALNTANLPEPTISPALDDVPSDYFNTVLYTGTGATQSITGVGFQPDWTWIKTRSGTFNHRLYDAIRGATLKLESNTTDAEAVNALGLTSFDSDGFGLGAASSENASAGSYVAWNWKANGAGVANTDGTISSTVSANQKAGFSIVSWTGLGSAPNTIGHGLGAAPKMIITKTRTASVAYNWNTYHDGLDAVAPEDYFVSLNTTAARTLYTAANLWNRARPTASVFSVNNEAAAGRSGDAMIAYCFAEVEGYSKFGSYTGNGSADGPFVWCGFRPAFVMVKKTDSTGNWALLDAERSPRNDVDDYLYANLPNAELVNTSADVDFLSNGFKIRNTTSDNNTSGGNYIFMAFAENPFKYSNAR